MQDFLRVLHGIASFGDSWKNPEAIVLVNLMCSFVQQIHSTSLLNSPKGKDTSSYAIVVDCLSFLVY